MVDNIPDSPTPSRPGDAFLRVVWPAAVPLALLCVVLLVTEQATRTLNGFDLAVAVFMVLTVVARALDALRHRGTTAQGEPATRSHVIGYAVRLVPLTAVAWLIARTIAL